MCFRDNLINLGYGLRGCGYSEKQICGFKLCLTFALLCEDSGFLLGKPFSSLVATNKTDAALLSSRLYEFFSALPYGLRDFAQNISVPPAAISYLVHIIEDENRPTTADLGYVFLSDGTQREGTAYTQNKDIDFIIDHLLGDANVQDATQARFLDASCGCGAFLVRTVQSLGKRCKEHSDAKSSWIDQDNFCGIEIDPQAALVAQAAVWIESRKAQLCIAKNSNEIAMIHAELPVNIISADAVKSDWLAYEPDYIIGNPPFMTPNEEQRPIMQILVGTFRVDYAAAWIVKAADCIRAKPSIKCGLIITNSVCQGAQVTPIWQPYADLIDIDFAVQPFEFGQDVQVWCVIIGFGAKNSKEKLLYKDRASEPLRCRHINYQLHNDRDMFLLSRKEQISGYPSMRQPQDPTGAIITKRPNRNSVLYVTADSMLKGEYSYVLSPEQQQLPTTNYIVIPRHSSEKRDTIPIGWYRDTRIIGNSSVCIIEGADLFLFAILMSNVHNAFAKYFCGRLEMRYRYSLGLIYNNFPIPKASELERAKIIVTASKLIQDSSCAVSTNYVGINANKARRHLNVLIDKLYNGGRVFASDRERVQAVYKLLCKQ